MSFLRIQENVISSDENIILNPEGTVEVQKQLNATGGIVSSHFQGNFVSFSDGTSLQSGVGSTVGSTAPTLPGLIQPVGSTNDGVDTSQLQIRLESNTTSIEQILDAIATLNTNINALSGAPTPTPTPLYVNNVEFSSGASIPQGTYDGADLSGTNLSSITIAGSSQFLNVDFSNCSLEDATLNGSNFRLSDFSGANLTNADFKDSYMAKVNFTNADMTGVVITDTFLGEANFTGVNLTPLLGQQFWLEWGEWPTPFTMGSNDVATATIGGVTYKFNGNAAQSGPHGSRNPTSFYT
jgi:hypothetical protein